MSVGIERNICVRNKLLLLHGLRFVLIVFVLSSKRILSNKTDCQHVKIEIENKRSRSERVFNF